MKALRILLYVLLTIAVLVVALGLFAKKDYHVERSTEINAPRAFILDQLSHYKNFKDWSPWQHLDPEMKSSVSSNDGEVGATYTWEGNDKVGKGKMTTTALAPDHMDLTLTFFEPWQSTAPAKFTLQELGEAKTKVTWGFDMHIGFPWNGLAMFTDVDAGVGPDYENGLKNLKTLCEDRYLHPKYRGFEVMSAEMPVKYYIGMRKVVPITDISKIYMETLPKTMEAVQKEKLSMAGAPSGLYWTFDEKAGQTDMTAAIPLAENKKVPGYETYAVGGGKALVIDYYGSYEKMGEAHMAMDDYMAEKGLESVPPVIEEYVTDPATQPDTLKWLSKVIYFVKQKGTELPMGD